MYGARLSLLLIFIAAPAISSAEDLGDLLQSRLAYMKDVAAYKWQRELPIEDLAREQQVVVGATTEALRRGLNIETSSDFFLVQIAAAKEIQAYWFEQWRNNPSLAPKNNIDLLERIRPQLIILGDQIIAALPVASVALGQKDITGLSSATSTRLIDAAIAVEKYPNQLRQVLDSGILRVGYTGDYPPFSSANVSAEPSGIDMDMARDLALALSARIHWIPSTWPTLMQDLQQSRFDIAMSGISINLDRGRTAFFSSAYHSGGKTPVIRCTDVERYNSMAKIDLPGTRVIVNPGGTNARFAQQHLQQAQIQLHEDNRSIFTEIVQGRADVMITDQIEVQLQSTLKPTLCAAMPDVVLTFSEKAYLMPQDIVWKEYVNTWLAQRKGDGTLAAIKAIHLNQL